MATFEMLYLRDVSIDDVATGLQRVAPDVGAALATMEGSPWLQVRALRWEQLPVVGGALAEALGCEVVGFGAQTTVGAVEVWIFREGELRRHLSYVGGGEGWLEVEGTPEPWEASFFVGGLEDDASEADRAAYRARAFAVGAWHPYVDGFAIGSTMGLPGFDERTGWSEERWVGPPPPAPSGQTNWPVLWLTVAFLGVLVADVLWLPGSSWTSTGIFVAQLVVFFALVVRLSNRPLL